MSQPQQPQVVAGLTLGFSIGQGGDGKHWGVMHINNGPLSTQVAFSQEVLETLDKDLPKQLHELFLAIKRANLGLTIAPSMDALKNVGRNNGHKA